MLIVHWTLVVGFLASWMGDAIHRRLSHRWGLLLDAAGVLLVLWSLIVHGFKAVP